MSLNEPVFAVVGNVKARNKHWRQCERKEIPYMVVAHHPKISLIDWDLWNINVVNLHLNKKATDEHSAYIDSLFERKICSYAVKNS
jgi:hypothetical protein